MRELLMQDTMAAVVHEIELKDGMRACVKNYDGGYVSLEVTNCKMSFGQIYAFMEKLKKKHVLDGYSCKKSSLEEVFNAHATESMYMDLNKRLDRRRTSASF